MQRTLKPTDLLLVLALARSGTLSGAGQRLGVDASTVFRSLRALEKRLGSTLFIRGHTGCTATELGEVMALHGERLEAVVETAQTAAGSADGPVEGRVRIASTDVLLHHLVIPSLQKLSATNPLLRLDVVDSYELANLSKRDADVAVRATIKPPEHMVGKSLGVINEAVYGKNVAGSRKTAGKSLDVSPWIVLDDAVPGHPSTRWRRRNLPDARIALNAASIQTVVESVAAGIGVGILPTFLARQRPDLKQLSPVIDECRSNLWLLCHPESRHLRRVHCVYEHLANALEMT